MLYERADSLTRVVSVNIADSAPWPIVAERFPILAQEFSEPFQVFNPKIFPGVPGTSPLRIILHAIPLHGD